MDKGRLWCNIVDKVLEGFHWHREGNNFITNAKQVNAGSITIYKDHDDVDIRVFGKVKRLNVPSADMIAESVSEYNNTVKLVSNTISEMLDRGRTPKKKNEESHTQLRLDI